MGEDRVLCEAAWWAFLHFAHLDQANAQIHCSPVRYSPITVRLAQALDPYFNGTEEGTATLVEVLEHAGQYPLDPGRIELDPKES